MDQSQSTGVNRREFLKVTSAATAMAGLAPTLAAEAADPAAMPTRMLGNTGVCVPVMGLGTGPIGMRTRKEATALFEEALNNGVNYFDTAPQVSGYGISQVALGDLLKTRRKETFVVTKCFGAEGEKTLAMLKQNLKELQTDYADVVYAHTLGDGKMDLETVMGPNGAMKALQKAQRDGLVRFIGVSGHNRTWKFLKLIQEFEIQVMMNAVNFAIRHIYDFETKVWPEAHKRGIALVAMKIYGGRPRNRRQEPKGGMITGDDVYPAFLYAQSLPNVSTVVMGPADRGELLQNIEWAKTYKPLSNEEMDALLERGKLLAEKWGPLHGAVV